MSWKELKCSAGKRLEEPGYAPEQDSLLKVLYELLDCRKAYHIMCADI